MTMTLPQWFTGYRANQTEAIDEVVDLFNAGNRVVVMEAPTGAGKTVIAESVRQRLDTRGLYVCTTKTLQEQFIGDYPYASLLQGRDNYPSATKGVSCTDCTKSMHKDGGGMDCHWCPVVADCSYEMAKRDALAASLAVLNTAYYLTEANGPGRFSQRPFVILDEADTLEDQMQKHVGLRISVQQAARFGIKPPEKVTVEASWGKWAELAREQVTAVITKEGRVGSWSKPGDIKRRMTLERLQGKLKFLAGALVDDEWVYTGNSEMIEFKPVTLQRSGWRFLWKHASRFLVMSATVISAQTMMDDLGYTESQEHLWAEVSVPSSFPPENRPVRVTPRATVTKKQGDGVVPPLADAIATIAHKHEGDNVLVHTVSYHLSLKLKQRLRVALVLAAHRAGHDPHLQPEVQTYSRASDRQRALARFRASNGGILLAPSLDRGVDLPDDACRVQVIAKVPFPNLGDRQVAKRAYTRNGRVWYAVQTIRTLVQMSGRAVRHEGDHAVTYVLDQQFMKLWREWSHLFPKWWVEAIDWRYTL